MATAKRLKSGSWKVRVPSHKEGNKWHYTSFTAPSKSEAERMAAEFTHKRERMSKGDLTVMDALEGYIKAKGKVLSPSTIRVHRGYIKNYFDKLGCQKLKRLSSEEVQLWISEMSTMVSPKTVANAYGLLTAATSMYAPDITFKVTLPKRAKRAPDSPSSEDVMELFDNAKSELKVCIGLAAFCGLRRGEICALTYGDLKEGIIHVDKDLVQDDNKEWILKDMPKTSESVRDVKLPKKVMQIIGNGDKEENIIKLHPNQITRRFTTLRDRLGLSVSFHSLRHYFASVGSVLGVPDTYLADFGGWRKDSPVMKSVYQNKIVPMSKIYSDKMTDFFDKLIENL